MSFFATPEEIEAIGALHSNPLFLPRDHILRSLRQIGTVVVAITVVQLSLLKFVRSRSRRLRQRLRSRGRDRGPSSNGTTDGKDIATPSPLQPTATDDDDDDDSARRADWKSSYQLTNLLVNLFLGTLGIYHHYRTIPRPATTIEERIEGWESLSIFSDIQIGYQLWALPVGYVFVGETRAMLFHHVQVVVVGFLSAFFSNGFRYVTPFFYGLIEISSVPLSVMNHFKTHPELIKERPGTYLAIRLIFAATFLTVRVVMWLPNMYDWLKDCAILCYTCENGMCYASLGLALLAGFGLTVLQLVWASKIIEGIIKAITGGGSKRKISAETKKKID